MHHMQCLTESATCYISAPIDCTCTRAFDLLVEGQGQGQEIRNKMDWCRSNPRSAPSSSWKIHVSCYIQMHNATKQSGKNVVTSTSEMCIGSLEKKYLVQSRDSCCFQESRVAKQCLDAAKFTGRQYIYYRWYNLPPWLHSRN